jgi:hypothetical protein
VLFVLGQIISDREPPRLGADENMRGWADGRIIIERSHRDVNKFAVTNDRVYERAAYLAVRIITKLVAKDHELIQPPRDDQLMAFDPSEGLEG